jgi:hypothetical protein
MGRGKICRRRWGRKQEGRRGDEEGELRSTTRVLAIVVTDILFPSLFVRADTRHVCE